MHGEVEGLGGQGPHGKGDSLGDLGVMVPMVRETVWGSWSPWYGRQSGGLGPHGKGDSLGGGGGTWGSWSPW